MGSNGCILSVSTGNGEINLWARNGDQCEKSHIRFFAISQNFECDFSSQRDLCRSTNHVLTFRAMDAENGETDLWARNGDYHDFKKKNL